MDDRRLMVVTIGYVGLSVSGTATAMSPDPDRPLLIQELAREAAQDLLTQLGSMHP